MKFRIRVQNSSDQPWWEEYDKPVTDAQAEGERLVEYFNSTLRPLELPRELLAVEVLDVNSVKDHQWQKQNAGTIIWGGRTYDKLKCRRCGITGKRFGLAESVTLDSRFARSKVYQRCDTSLQHQQERRKANG
jgi:hypothetical protein